MVGLRATLVVVVALLTGCGGDGTTAQIDAAVAPHDARAADVALASADAIPVDSAPPAASPPDATSIDAAPPDARADPVQCPTAGADAGTASGIVYERQAARAYTLDGPFFNGVGGATITVGSSTIGTSAECGSYSVDLRATVPTTVSFHHDGYADSWFMSSFTSRVHQDIGLYPTPTVTPRPGFLKGIVTFDDNPGIQRYYADGVFQTTYDRVANLGGNLVAFSDVVDITQFSDNSITMSEQYMLTRDEYLVLVKAAHDRGLAFMLIFNVAAISSPSYGSFIGTVPPTNTAFWDAWFRAYTQICRDYAVIARDAGIDYISLTLVDSYVTVLPVAYWQGLVAAVRDAGYTGKLMTLNFNGEANEGHPAPFAALFDVIGVQIMQVVNGTTPPSREALRDGLRHIIDAVVEWSAASRPLVVMLSTPSTDKATIDPAYFEPCIACNPDVDAYRMDLYQQADAYQAFFEMLNAGEVPHVIGLVSWGYFYTEDCRNYPNPDSWACEKSANIRGKPAEAVASWWFKRL